MAVRFVLILLFISLIVVPGPVVSAQTASSSGAESRGIITGKIHTKEGSPLAGGYVWLYDASTGPPPFKNHIMRPPFLRIEINADGIFRAELAPGKYYLRAVKRLSPEKAGLRDGDYVYYGLNNRGEAKEYIIKSGKVLDIGTLSEAVPYKTPQDAIKTAIEGTINDTDGKPVGGVTVFAFQNYAQNEKPLYFSKRTEADGKYILSLPEGTFYLRARNRLKGGIPERGQLLGMFGGEAPVPVTVKDGEIVKEINITVTTFPGRGRESRTGMIPGPPQSRQP